MSSRTNVVVLGSGAAGMAAAVAAAVEGASVTVLESAAQLGGTTALSGAGIWIPANPWSAADGIADSPEDALRYLHQIAPAAEDAVLSAYVAQGVRVTKTMEHNTKLRWQYLAGFPDYHSEIDGGALDGRALESAPVQVSPDALAAVRPDLYEWPLITINEEVDPPDRAEIERRHRSGIAVRGRGMIAALYDALRERGGQVHTNILASELIMSGQSVVGVRAGNREFPGQVVLGTGGFERNAQLVRCFLPGPMVAPAGPPSNRGHALVMAIGAGAALGNMSDAWFVPAMRVPGELIDGAPFYRVLFTDASRPGGLLVDSRGRRFVNEALDYYGVGRSLHQLDVASFSFPRTPSYFVFDAARRRDGVGPIAGGARDPDWLARADSVEQLASIIGVPSSGLRETVDRFNANADAGADPDFGRGASAWDAFSSGTRHGGMALRGLTEAPFYAIEVLPGCSGTKGGLVTDALGRAIRIEDGAVLSGLYAAGNAAAYPFGLSYPGPGATVGPALVFGWLAGETAARSA